MSNAKKPQDRKKKGAVDALRAEAENIPGIAETEGKRLTVVGKLGEVTVTTLISLDWDAEVPGLLREGDYLAAICGMVSPEDAAALRGCRPTLGSLMAAIYAPADESGEASVGESQAS